MKRLLITGAYGLVGSNICKVLERDYPDIEITKCKFDTIEHDGVIYFDYIIHAAGYGQPQMFGKDKITTIEINTKGTDNLFKNYLKTNGKFLFVSSSEIYSGAPSPHKETDIGTTTPQHPRACYIEGKRCGEAICMAYKEQGYDVKITRLALAYGPGTKKGDTRVINQFIEQGIMKGCIRMIDDGSDMRNYIYVEDAVKLMISILFYGKDCVYNVGGNSETSIHDLAFDIAELCGVPMVVGETISARLPGAPESVKLDMTKTLSEFPMEFLPLDIGLDETVKYQKQLYGVK